MHGPAAKTFSLGTTRSTATLASNSSRPLWFTTDSGTLIEFGPFTFDKALLLALDLMQGKLQGGWGRQPVLQGTELLLGTGAGGGRQRDNRAGRTRRSAVRGKGETRWRRSD